jgi:hypothetical protein
MQVMYRGRSRIEGVDACIEGVDACIEGVDACIGPLPQDDLNFSELLQVFLLRGCF